MSLISSIAWLASAVPALLQPQPAHWTGIVTAIGIAVLAVLGLGVAIALLWTLRTVNRTLRSVQRGVEALAPKTEPLLDKATKVADDAGEITGALRGEVRRVQDTVEEVTRQLRTMTTSTEARVRRFGAVLDAVQAETEKVLLDATATARGIHTTTKALQRRPRGDGGRQPPDAGAGGGDTERSS